MRSPQAIVDEDPIACGATGDVLRGTWRGKEMAIKVLQVRHGTLTKDETDGLIKSFSREVRHRCCAVLGADCIADLWCCAVAEHDAAVAAAITTVR